LIVTISAPQDQQSFSLEDIEDSATTQAQQNQVPTATLSAVQASKSAVADASSTSSPLPTFTIPSAPETQPWEHFWLNRPVPDGEAIWTDKAYPYGSTRGGLLRAHHGVEFNVPTGTEVLSTARGIVRVAGNDSEDLLGASTDFYGNVVVIEVGALFEGKPIYTLYGHLSNIFVDVGQEVQAQDVIALSGASGVADGAHLHFEVRVGENDYSATRNPLLWLYPFPERGVVAGRANWTDGQLATQVPVNLRRIDAGSQYATTTTYASGDLNPDDNWQENFAFDDVLAGYYELTVEGPNNKVQKKFWVYPYQTSFVDIVLEP
jgi:murein DD-endopeptidase MepM/ murein hydrolase activator NlpD